MSTESVRLTRMVADAGSATKLGPPELAQALSHLVPIADPRLLAGRDTRDDAAVIKLRDDLAICLSADLITPVVDDPIHWGWIAAAGSVSNVLAMGATPVVAVNLVCWPKGLAIDLLGQVLGGGLGAAAAADCLIVGGHTIQDEAPKYGLAVIATVHPERILRRRGAQPGDQLYLTKALGTGIIATAIRNEVAGEHEVQVALLSMRALNLAGSQGAVAASARAMTDVGGFGLAGQVLEMLGPPGVLGVRISFRNLPLLPRLIELIDRGMIPDAAHRNRDAFQKRVSISGKLPPGGEWILYDPQTSGGLLVAVPPDSARQFETEVANRHGQASQIGHFTQTGMIDVAA